MENTRIWQHFQHYSQLNDLKIFKSEISPIVKNCNQEVKVFKEEVVKTRDIIGTLTLFNKNNTPL